MNSIKTIIDNILTKLKYVGLSNTFKYYYFRICKIKKLIQIKIDEKRIFIRTNSPATVLEKTVEQKNFILSDNEDF